MNKHIAVIGMGYWGKNLARNFHELGALHTICDTSPAVEKEWKAKYPGVQFTQAPASQPFGQGAIRSCGLLQESNHHASP